MIRVLKKNKIPLTSLSLDDTKMSALNIIELIKIVEDHKTLRKLSLA